MSDVSNYVTLHKASASGNHVLYKSYTNGSIINAPLVLSIRDLLLSSNTKILSESGQC